MSTLKPPLESRWIWSLVGAVFLITLAIHLPFALFDAFGEQDAARIAIAAQYGNLSGHLALSNQWPFSTPGYIHLLTLALRAEVISGEDIICAMTMSSLLFSSLFSAAFALFTLTATGSLITACAMTALVQLCPFFWLSSLYGFPTIVALGLFMVSVTLFQAAFTKKGIIRITGIAAAVVVFFASVLCKVDTVTAAALFCLPVWQSPKTFRQKLIWTAGLFLMAVAAFWLLNRYGVTLSKYKTASRNWQDWTTNFYSGVSAIFSTNNVEIIGRAAGVASFPLALAATLLAVWRRTCRTIIFWILSTILPVTLFWSMIAGNSARHNLIPAVFVTVLMALPLRFLTGISRKVWGGCIIAVCVLNYVFFPPTSSTIKPSGRLIRSAQMMEESVDRRTRKAREIPTLPDEKILVLVPNHLIPIYYFEALTAPHLEFIKKGGGRVYLKDRATGKKKMLFYPDAKRRKKALNIAKKEGYLIIKGQ